MKYMNLLRNRAKIETYYYTVVILVKRNTLISYLYFYRTFMFLLFMSVAKYQSLDVLSISSHGHFYSECVSLNYPRSLFKLVPSSNRVSGHLNCSYVTNWDILFFYFSYLKHFVGLNIKHIFKQNNFSRTRTNPTI